MKDFKRDDLLFSLCGLNCSLCQMKLGGYCPGCGGGAGNQPCKIAACAGEHGGVEYCSGCVEFPCERYENPDAYDVFIPGRNRLADLLRQRASGAEAYNAVQLEKVQILQTLLNRYNDGRRKTFFCVAVNLLEPDDLRRVLAAAGEKDGFKSLKEASAFVCGMLSEIAAEKGIELKLRKKPKK